MKTTVCSLVIIFILIMALAGGCVRAAANEPAGPAASPAYPVTSRQDPQELERFLDALVAERMEMYHTPAKWWR
jgi:hypothetical protein